MAAHDPLLAPMKGAARTELAGVVADVAPAGAGRIKRVIYPAGFRWSRDMKAQVGTEHCMHAHVGFLARGHVQVQYPDGCTEAFVAPQVVVIAPEHDAWVVGPEPAVIIEVDFLAQTAETFGLPATHRHPTGN
jgi:hypothetical protein